MTTRSKLTHIARQRIRLYSHDGITWSSDKHELPRLEARLEALRRGDAVRDVTGRAIEFNCDPRGGKRRAA